MQQVNVAETRGAKPSLGSVPSRNVTAAALLGLAAVSWAVVFVRYSRSAPVQQHIDAGRAYAQAGEAKNAEKEWREAVRLDPKNGTAWVHLAGLYYSTGSWPAGVEAYRRALQLKPDQPHLHSDLAVCLLRSGDERAAYDEAQAELKREPNDIPALTISATLISQMHEVQQEIGYLRRLEKLQPDNTLVLQQLAESLLFSHDYDSALPVLDRLVQLDRANSEPYSLRGMCNYSRDRSPASLNSAEKDFDRALAVNPVAAFPRLYLGKIFRQRGELSKARFQLETARRLMPGKMDIYFELASLYQQMGETKLAADARNRYESLRQAIDLKESLKKRCSVNPQDFDSHLRIGLITLKDGDYHEARAYLNRAAALRPGDGRVVDALQQLSRATGRSTAPTLPETGRPATGAASSAPPDGRQ